MAAAPVFDESYAGAPVALLENSNAGLNEQLVESARVEEAEVAPLTFDFLFPEARTSEAAPCGNIADITGALWQPNLEAPEFIPTMTMECPLVGVCHVIAEEGGETQRTEVAASAGVRPETQSWPRVFDVGTPRHDARPKALTFDISTPRPGAKGFSATSSPSHAKVQKPKKPGKKRKTSHLQVPPAPKRSKSGDRGEPLPRGQALEEEEPEEEDQHRPRTHVQGEMPEATEEEWQHRIVMRTKAIEIGKNTPEYQRYAERVPKEERTESCPSTPDMTDRTVSKRRWKYDVQQWRTKLKQRHLSELGLLEAAGALLDKWTKPTDTDVVDEKDAGVWAPPPSPM